MTSLGLDSQGMADATAGLPEQVEDAAAAAQRVGEPELKGDHRAEKRGAEGGDGAHALAE